MPCMVCFELELIHGGEDPWMAIELNGETSMEGEKGGAYLPCRGESSPTTSWLGVTWRGSMARFTSKPSKDNLRYAIKNG